MLWNNPDDVTVDYCYISNTFRRMVRIVQRQVFVEWKRSGLITGREPMFSDSAAFPLSLAEASTVSTDGRYEQLINAWVGKCHSWFCLQQSVTSRRDQHFVRKDTVVWFLNIAGVSGYRFFSSVAMPVIGLL